LTENELRTPVNLCGPFEEERDVVFKHSEGRIEVLQDANHTVMALHSFLGSLKGPKCVEGPAIIADDLLLQSLYNALACDTEGEADI
jgi:hypothetical protein